MVSFSKSLFALLSVCLVSVNASDDGYTIYHADDFPVQACTGIIGKTATFFPSTAKNGYCDVNNQPALGTMAECIEMMMNYKNKNSRKLFITSCKKKNLTEDQYYAALQNATDFGFVNTTAETGFNKSELYYKPVLLTQKKVDRAYDAVATRWYNYNYAQWFGIALMSYWFGVLFIAGIVNLCYFLFPSLIKSFKGKLVNAFRKYLTLPALFNKTHVHHKVVFKYLVLMFPTRLESLIVVGWFAMALTMCCTNYVHVVPNYIWPDTANEIGRKVADRTGQIVMWLMPPLVLFAGRNNFMQWVSGWPYARFVYIHKWMSRIVFIMSIAHAVGMTYNGRILGKYVSRFQQPYVRWGTVSIVAMGVMCFQSLMFFRRNNYEVFVMGHIILAVFAIAGLWLHTKPLSFDYWMIAAVSVWVFDHVVRLGRLFSFGLHTAQVQLIANETVRVTVSRPAWWIPFPGCHAFIHFMRPTCFWQSHPFTIIDSVVETKTITFYLKVKGGMTHGLYQYLAKQPSQTASIKVSVEGPYGNPIAINRFESSVFVAGGNGIPGLYYEATSIAKKFGESRSIKFYWVIRHYRSLEWFYQELQKLKDLPSITPIVYVTQPHVGLTEPIETALTDDELEQEEEQEKKSDSYEKEDYIVKLRKQLSHIEFREYRPDFYQIIGEEIKETVTPLAIASCAHGSMVDDVRKSVADHLDDSKYRIELFEQIQGW
ncbi:hypothetical protein CANMA_003635 [Candida margitis]|uniref:uncharacterized protein n=1 Tax=Candida margitis TaxID=1775924 RepID=UPI002226DC23|nr:uncharacterized protein CANMA_003635 [Candida margitis]KAI5962860.1 hypothetical protein CANMA_003635 [Candida margitis]